MRIAISILNKVGANLWSNGIDQNVYHLACLLREVPFVEQVLLLNTGDQDQPPKGAGALGAQFPLVDPNAACDHIDVAIEMSGGLHPEWLARFRARGGKAVFHNCGQPYAALIEPSIFERPGFLPDPERCDEIWLFEKDRDYAAMMRGIYRCPVREVPYLWAPVFLEDTVRGAAQEGLGFGFRPGMLSAGGASPAIFEPNISAIKMGIIPYMICEAAERQAPGTVKAVRFLNSKQMAEQSSFVFLMNNSILCNSGRVVLDGRDYFARVMGAGANMVVSHQLRCPQNYLYLDALFGNYPLIHNSPLFADVGYHYPGSDIAAGAAAFMDAIRNHDRHLADHAARNARLFDRLSPAARHNRDVYARHLVALTAGKGRKAA